MKLINCTCTKKRTVTVSLAASSSEAREPAVRDAGRLTSAGIAQPPPALAALQEELRKAEEAAASGRRASEAHQRALRQQLQAEVSLLGARRAGPRRGANAACASRRRPGRPARPKPLLPHARDPVSPEEPLQWFRLCVHNRGKSQRPAAAPKRRPPRPDAARRERVTSRLPAARKCRHVPRVRSVPWELSLAMSEEGGGKLVERSLVFYRPVGYG